MNNYKQRDDVYTIFQSLNSKNTPLNQADLIKSHLMAVSSMPDRATISIQWKNLLTHIRKPDDILYEAMLSRNNNTIPKKRLYEVIRNEYTKDKVNTYLDELKEDLEIINKLNKPKDIADPNLKYILFCLSKVGAKYFRRVAIAAMRQWGHDNKKTVELIEFLSKFFFMYRTICKKDISTLRVSSRHAVNKIKSNCTLPQIFSTILLDKNNHELIDQKEFEQTFKNTMGSFSADIATYVLVSLEHHYESSDIQYPIDKLQLEHIFPKKPKISDWSNIDENKKHKSRLGNLTLVTNEWNPTLSNNSFKQKMLGDGGRDSICYNNSRLEINKRLRTYKKCEMWSATEMSEREIKILEDDVPTIWNMKHYSDQIK